LGRAYALLYAKLGAKVVVNDIDKKRVESTLADIKSGAFEKHSVLKQTWTSSAAGGEAIGIACSTEEGDRIIQAALQAYGTVSVVVTNAGNLRDKSFAGMTERDWDEVYRTHAYGTFAVCKAAWPVFRKNKYGRILTVSSTSGIYGNFGQANYAAGKTAVVGLARTLALEGAKYGIKANALVPTAWTNMTSPLWPAKMKEPFSADWVAAVVAYLTSQECQETGSIIEAAAGWAAKLAWSRTGGYAFSNVRPATPEEVRDKWSEISRFGMLLGCFLRRPWLPGVDEKATKPTSGQESLKQIMGNFNKS
jgi:multifunctional beta-oxidation protein